MSDLSVADTRAKLKEQFAKFGGDRYGEGWADLVSIATFNLPPCSVPAFSPFPRPDRRSGTKVTSCHGIEAFLVPH
jgi:hypothetical protein